MICDLRTLGKGIEMDVLVRAKINSDGRTASIAPGVELPVRALDIATDMPPVPEGLPHACIMFFETHEDLQEFAELFADDPAIHVRDL